MEIDTLAPWLVTSSQELLQFGSTRCRLSSTYRLHGSAPGRSAFFHLPVYDGYIPVIPTSKGSLSGDSGNTAPP